MIDLQYNYSVLTLTDLNETNREIDITGRFLHVESTTAPFTIRLNVSSNAEIPMGNKDRIIANFTKLFITTTAATTLTLFISSSPQITLDSNQISEIIEDRTWYWYTERDQAFAAYEFMAQAGGEYSHTQLWNPADSGVNGYLNAVTVSAQTAGLLGFGYYATELSTSRAAGNSKKLGTATSSLNRARQTDSGTLTTGGFLFELRARAYGSSEGNRYKFEHGIMIPPGFGFVIRNSTVNDGLETIFEWVERPV